MNRLSARAANLLLAIGVAILWTASAHAQKAKTYKTPEKAVDAFVAAVRAGDTKTLTSIFGSESQRLFESGDTAADSKLRSQFLELYDQKHSFLTRSDGSKMLQVGSLEWPFPIPIAKSGSSWKFDTAAGLDEIINRRIGRNELSTIQTVLAIGDAQREYYAVDRDGDAILEYAQHFRSTVGLHDGLYWPTDAQGCFGQSPLGQLVATASEEGYSAASNTYHGYRFKLMSAQGPAAQGGAYDYVARGNQIGGFAVAAWPADYGDSGIMTFIMNHSGVVYQKDLGADSQSIMEKMAAFDPGDGWTVVSDKDTAPMVEADDAGNAP